MSNPLADLLPALLENEQCVAQQMRVDGDDVVLPVHLFAGSGKSAMAEARFPCDGSDEPIIKAALAQAVDEARARL